jgi:Rrf2 family transcriptional regulator, iron-sulfur cluster assembly transcription factor
MAEKIQFLAIFQENRPKIFAPSSLGQPALGWLSIKLIYIIVSMKLSTRSRYGTRLMLELAEHYPEGPVHLGEIAKRQDVSVKYLEQIIIPLKRAHYIESVRGSRGGHILTKPPEEITVGEIVALLEEGTSLVECVEDATVCDRADTCPTRLLWQEASKAMFDWLEAVTLADLLERARAMRARC